MDSQFKAAEASHRPVPRVRTPWPEGAALALVAGIALGLGGVVYLVFRLVHG